MGRTCIFCRFPPSVEGDSQIQIHLMRHYTADLHFGHENIIDLCDRPYPSLKEMEEEILDAWCRCLGQDDVLFILGDLGGPRTQTDHVRSLIKRCPAPVRWIMGNHDREAWPAALDEYAEHCGDRVEIRTDRADPRDDHPVFLVLDHYPMASWNRAYHGAVHLHGHVHGRFDNGRLRRFDVGVDSIGVEPIQESEIIDRALEVDPPKYKTA